MNLPGRRPFGMAVILALFVSGSDRVGAQEHGVVPTRDPEATLAAADEAGRQVIELSGGSTISAPLGEGLEPTPLPDGPVLSMLTDVDETVSEDGPQLARTAKLATLGLGAKRASVRPKSVAAAASVVIAGSWQYNVASDHRTVRLRVGRVENRSPSGFSGTLKLALYATLDRPTSNGTINGFNLAEHTLGQLSAGQYFYDIDATIQWQDPAPGTYYISLLVLEYTTSGWVYTDLSVASERQTFGGGDAGALRFEGAWTWEIRDLTWSRLRVDRIVNSRPIGTQSGTLKLILWASLDRPVEGSYVEAYSLSEHVLGQLLGGHFWSDIDTGNMPVTPPPDGLYYITMGLSEWDGSAYVTRHFRVADQRLRIGSGSGGGSELQLLNNRVKVAVTWRNQYNGQTGAARPIRQNEQFGFFYFSDPSNPEVFVKALDFGSTRPYLLFYGGLTDLEYVVSFTNNRTGRTVRFTKPAGGYGGGGDSTSLPQ